MSDTLYPINEAPAEAPGRDTEEPMTDRWQCGECPKTFSDFGLLTAHLMCDHDDD